MHLGFPELSQVQSDLREKHRGFSSCERLLGTEFIVYACQSYDTLSNLEKQVGDRFQ